MDIVTAKTIIKAINRHCRKNDVFLGGRTWGYDYNTFAVTFPQITKVFNEAVTILTGRKGRFLPIF